MYNSRFQGLQDLTLSDTAAVQTTHKEFQLQYLQNPTSKSINCRLHPCQHTMKTLMHELGYTLHIKCKSCNLGEM